jgi:hypothetical protein
MTHHLWESADLNSFFFFLFSSFSFYRMRTIFSTKRRSRGEEKKNATTIFLDQEERTNEEKEHCCSLTSANTVWEKVSLVSVYSNRSITHSRWIKEEKDRDMLSPFLSVDFTRVLYVWLATLCNIRFINTVYQRCSCLSRRWQGWRRSWRARIVERHCLSQVLLPQNSSKLFFHFFYTWQDKARRAE